MIQKGCDVNKILTYPAFCTGSVLRIVKEELQCYSSLVSKAAYNDAPHFHNLLPDIHGEPTQGAL